MENESEPSAKQPVRSLQPTAGVHVEHHSSSVHDCVHEPRKSLQPVAGVNAEHKVKAKKIQVATATEDVSCPSVGMLNMVPGLMVDLNPPPGIRPVRC